MKRARLPIAIRFGVAHADSRWTTNEASPFFFSRREVSFVGRKGSESCLKSTGRSIDNKTWNKRNTRGRDRGETSRENIKETSKVFTERSADYDRVVPRFVSFRSFIGRARCLSRVRIDDHRKRKLLRRSTSLDCRSEARIALLYPHLQQRATPTLMAYSLIHMYKRGASSKVRPSLGILKNRVKLERRRATWNYSFICSTSRICNFSGVINWNHTVGSIRFVDDFLSRESDQYVSLIKLRMKNFQQLQIWIIWNLLVWVTNSNGENSYCCKDLYQ